MKIAIIGAGAIGGYVGVKLALAGEDVTFIVRGENLRAIREQGMRLVMHDGMRKGEESTLDYADMKLRELPDKIFTKDYLKRLE